jgi:alpha-L-fucosidase
LREFHRILEETFARNLAEQATLKASDVRGASKEFGPDNLLRATHDRYWATDGDVRTPDLILEFSQPVRFNVVSLREYLPLGQRVEAFGLDRWDDGSWVEFGHGTSIGNHRLIRGDFVTTQKVRLRVTAASVCPALAELGLFAEPQ